MLLDVYLVRDLEYNTVATFTSKHKALNFCTYNKNTEVEHIKVQLIDAAMREIHHINVKEQPAVKTMRELAHIHVSYVVYDICNGVIAKAARILDMSDTNLRHKLKQMGLK